MWASATSQALPSIAGGPNAVIVCLVLSAISMVIAAQYLPTRTDVAACQQGHGTTIHRLSAKDAVALVHSPLFLVFLLASGAIQGAHGMFYTFGALHWRGKRHLLDLDRHALGDRRRLRGAALRLLWSRCPPSRRHAPSHDCRCCSRRPLDGDVLRSALAASHSASGAAWAHLWRSPPRRHALHFESHAAFGAGTAQAFYATIAAGILLGAATLLAGHLYGRVGSLGFAAMAAIAAIGFAASLVLARKWDGGLLTKPSP